jgi:Flp pilus assembly pilin Flp
MRFLARDFLTNGRGASSIEYAFITCLIAVAIFASVAALGTNLSLPYTHVADGLK